MISVGGPLVWTLDVPAHLGVSVRVGEKGALVPATRSRVWVGDAPEATGTHLQARYPLTAAPLAVTLAQRDLAQAAARDALVQVTATVYHPDGVSVHTLGVEVHDDAPDGSILALVTADGTYFTGEGLPDAPWTLRVTTDTGGTYDSTNPAQGVTFAPEQTARPVTAILIDDEGRESENLLVGVEVEAPDGADATEFAAWPLPADLNPAEEQLASLLRAAEDALDIRPDQAGRHLNATLCTGEVLSVHGRLFGVTRTEAPTDGAHVRRILGTLTRWKSTLPGLEAMLRVHGVYGGRVVDAAAYNTGGPLVFDGSWTFDGSRFFNGGIEGPAALGEVIGVFRRVPTAGLNAALDVLRRYKAAGVRVRVMHLQPGRQAVPRTGTRVVIRRRATLTGPVTTRNLVPALTFDGTWTFDGQLDFDGARN